MQQKDNDLTGGMGGILVVIILLGIIGWWAASTFRTPQWSGIYGSKTTNALYEQKFSSKEECQRWLFEKRYNPGNYENYECGSNCKPPTTEMGLYKCDETFD